MKHKRYTQGGYDWVSTPPYRPEVIDGYKPSLCVKMTINVLDMAVFVFFLAILLIGLDAMFCDGVNLYHPICDWFYNIGR